MLTFSVADMLEVYGLEDTDDLPSLINDFKQVALSMLGESVEVI